MCGETLTGENCVTHTVSWQEQEEVGMDGGNGSLIMEFVWAGHCLGCFLHHNDTNLCYRLNQVLYYIVS